MQEFNLERANKVKASIEQLSIAAMVKYAQLVYPNECCGFILDNGTLHPAQNVVHELYDSSLTSRNAFLIDTQSWQRASSQEHSIIGIYHSHTNGDPDMSSADQTFLQWKHYCYVVLALSDSHPVASKLFWWEGSELKQLPIAL